MTWAFNGHAGQLSCDSNPECLATALWFVQHGAFACHAGLLSHEESMVQLQGGLAPVMPGCGFKAAPAKRVITELELGACSRAPSMASAWPAVSAHRPCSADAAADAGQAPQSVLLPMCQGQALQSLVMPAQPLCFGPRPPAPEPLIMTCRPPAVPWAVQGGDALLPGPGLRHSRA